MPASPRAELVFRYERDVEGVYHGSAQLLEPTGDSARPPLEVVVRRADWVRFVVDTIRALPDSNVAVIFELKKPDSTSFRHAFDPRTVDKIKSEELSLDDLIL